MQKILLEYNRSKIESERIHLCVGVGFGRLLRIGDYDVFGAEVNAASKLGEDVAKAEEILITDSIKKAVEANDQYTCEPINVIPPGAKAAFKLLY